MLLLLFYFGKCTSARKNINICSIPQFCVRQYRRHVFLTWFCVVISPFIHGIITQYCNRFPYYYSHTRARARDSVANNCCPPRGFLLAGGVLWVPGLLWCFKRTRIRLATTCVTTVNIIMYITHCWFEKTKKNTTVYGVLVVCAVHSYPRTLVSVR